MKQFFYLLTASVVVLSSCNGSFKKGEKGMEYKIVSNGDGKTIQNGNYFEIQFEQTYKSADKDTVLYDSKKYANQIATLDSTAIPPAYYKIFSQAKKGDSIIVKQLIDSIMTPENPLPPYMKKGGSLIAYYKIVNVYTTKEAADSAYKAQMELAKIKDSVNAIAQLQKDDKVIVDYLKSKNIKAQKTPKGVYVEILQAGTGAKVTDSVGVQMKYTGKSFAGKAFDSNIDSTFGHTDLLPVQMWAPRVIAGWVDGLRLLAQGSKARFYIPSSLAYGTQGQQPSIAPDENLIFEVEVVAVSDKKKAMAEEMAMQKKMMEQQKQMQAMQEKMKGQQAPQEQK